MADTKNPGPLLVSFGAGDINALPVEWRARMGYRQEDQQMPLGYVLPTNGAGTPPQPDPVVISENRLLQTRTDERKRTSVVLNPPPPNGGQVPPGGGPPDSWTLVAEERLPWGQVATRTRAFVPDGSHLVLTDDMLSAEQRNLGIGLDQVVLTAPLPGPGIVDTKFDNTASLVSTIKTRKLISTIVDGETIIGNVWRQVTHESETATVASEVVVSRTLPGPTLPSTRFDNNSVLVTINRTKKLTSLINEGETVTPTLWLKTYGDGETGLISTEIVESRPLPGPVLLSTKFDNEAVLVTTTKTQKKTDQFVDGETIVGNVWQQTTREAETANVATQVVLSRTLPGPTIPSTRFDNNSVLVTINKTKKLTSTIVGGETVTPTLWTKTYGDGETGLISTEISEVRALPGPAIISSRFDTDNTLVTITETQKKADQFTDGENVVGNVWTRTTRKGETGQVATEVKESRTIPGPAIVGFRLDGDGAIVTVTKTKKLIGNIVEGEVATPTSWTRTYSEAENVLIATEVVEQRALGANAPTVTTSHYDSDNTLVTVAKTKQKFDQFNDSESYNPGTQVWTRVTREGVSKLVVEQVVESRTLPGQAITSYRLDDDGATVTIVKTKKLLSLIAAGEVTTSVLWTKTFAEGQTLLFATEVVETRPLGSPTVQDFRLDTDGAIVTISKIKKRIGDIVEVETATPTLWTKVSSEAITSKVAWEVTQARPLGTAAPVMRSSRIDQGLVVNITKNKKQATSVVDPTETANSSSWTKTYREDVDGTVATEVVETAALPGPDVVSTRLEADGRFTTITKTRRFFSDVTSSEAITNGQWVKTYKEGESGKLATQVVESRSVVAIAANVVRSAHVDQDLEIVTVTKATKADTAITPSAAIAAGNLTTVEKREITDLVAEEIKSVKPTFDPVKYGFSIENPLPPEFRSLGIVSDEIHLVAGQAVVPGNLLANELEKSQEQINALQKRTVLKTINTGSFPIAFAGKEILLEFGGVLVNTEQKIALATDSSVDIVAADVTTTAIVRDRITRHAGFKVREKATVVGAFPILSGGNVDPEFPFIYRFTEQVVDAAAAGTVPGIGTGTITEIKPLDVARSLKRITSIPTTGTGTDNINNFKLSFPGTTNVSIPPQLISLTAINAGTGGGAGSYGSNGSYGIVNEGSGRLDLKGEANSSASASIDVTTKVKQIWGQDIPCMHYLFFVLGPTVAYNTVLGKLNTLFSLGAVAWPKFQPEAINFSCVNNAVDARAQADQHMGEAVAFDYLGRITRGGSNRAGGSGTETQSRYTVKTVTIPPTIHAAISFSGTVVNSGSYNASATIATAGVGTTTASTHSQASAFVSPGSFTATGGQSTIPTGTFLHKVKVEPWKYNYFKVDCEVVSSNDW